MSTQIRGLAPAMRVMSRSEPPAAWSGSWPSTRVAPAWLSSTFASACGQVARDGDEPVVGAGVDRDRSRAERRDEAVHRAQQLGPGAGGRRQEPGRALEELGVGALGAARLGAADRVAADEARVAAGGGADGALRRADVGDDAALAARARAPRARRAGARPRAPRRGRGRRRRPPSASVATGSTASRSLRDAEHVGIGVPAAHGGARRAARRAPRTRRSGPSRRR